MAAIVMGLFAAGAALGVLLVIQGLRGRVIIGDPTRRLGGQVGLGVASGWLGSALVAGLLVGVITGWPVLGVGTVVAMAAGPRLLGGQAERRREVARTQEVGPDVGQPDRAAVAAFFVGHAGVP